jgi:hypothetical protein
VRLVRAAGRPNRRMVFRLDLARVSSAALACMTAEV